MITFLELGKHGRLGNQLFQYAALKGIALRNNYECKIPDPKQMMWHGQQSMGILPRFLRCSRPHQYPWVLPISKLFSRS